jgi:hypothetical protein
MISNFLNDCKNNNNSFFSNIENNVFTVCIHNTISKFDKNNFIKFVHMIRKNIQWYKSISGVANLNDLLYMSLNYVQIIQI